MGSSIYPIPSTAAAPTFYRADVQASWTSVSSNGSNGSFTYVNRNSGVTVTGQRFRIISSGYLNVGAVNAGHFGGRLSISAAAATFAYAATLDVTGYSTYNGLYTHSTFAKHGASVTSPIYVDSYSVFDWQLAPSSQGSLTSGYYQFTNTCDITFVSRQIGVTFTPAVAVAKQNGMTSILADLNAWDLTAEIVG